MSKKTQTKKAQSSRKRRRMRAGWSIPGAAEEVGTAYKTMRTAVERGQVKVIEFGGLRWVPNSEVERLKGIFAE
jgi:hypothetical protein